MEYVLLALMIVQILLHFIAPRTKATWDDKLVAPIDAAVDFVKGSVPDKSDSPPS